MAHFACTTVPYGDREKALETPARKAGVLRLTIERLDVFECNSNTSG